MIDALGIVVRWATFAAILSAIGAVVFHWMVFRPAALGDAPRERGSPRTAAVARGAMMALVPLAGVRLAVQTAAMRFPDESWAPVASRLVAETGWGHTWMVQMAAAVLLSGAFTVAHRGQRRGWVVAVPVVLALTATLTMSSHAMTGEHHGVISVAADAVHVLAAGSWLGTLAMMVVAVSGHRAGAGGGEGDGVPDLTGLLRRFSPLAQICVALVLASGVISSLGHVEHLRELTDTAYGQWLFRKVVVVVIVLLLGFRNWRRLTPAVQTDGASGGAAMRRGMVAELGVALLVLLLTAVLVGTPPPMHPMAM